MQSVIPGGGSVVLPAGRLVMELFCTLGNDDREHRVFWKIWR
jgi:hypothetical protein